ncbi:DUF3817 domain-containing protein [Saccharopolyspora cebuensis]|uniref:DUF3817 domain-containing protein n=1 Tax=Saccharopolyspora cebuensis TaxID=418759 RepID=A0ABV4CIK8_9PSEU
MRVLRWAARAELVTLALMLANLATAHLPQVSALLGPAHGCAYLVVVLGTWRWPDAGAKVLALLPAVGGLLALRRLDRAPAPGGC